MGVALHMAWPKPCTSRAANTMECVAQCLDTAEVERMAGVEPAPWPWKGLALPVELHPLLVEDWTSAIADAAFRQIVKELIRPCVDAQDEKKARILAESGPAGCRKWRQRLDACLPRMDAILMPAKLRHAGCVDARKRGPALLGQIADGGGPACHDEPIDTAGRQILV